MKKTMMIIVKRLIALITLLCIMPVVFIPAAADYTLESDKKMDYAGLLTRAEKIEMCDNIWLWGWSYKIFCQLYPINVRNLTDPDVGNGDMGDTDEIIQKTLEVWEKEDMQKAYTELYSFIKVSGISRDEFEFRMTNLLSTYYDSNSDENKYPKHNDAIYADYAKKITNALYSEDDRTIIETLLAPEMVVNPLAYNDPNIQKYYEVQLEEFDGASFIVANTREVFISPHELIEIPLETLETWNYSDEFWYDYYSFIDQINDGRFEGSEADYNIRSSSFSRLEHADRLAELDRRLEIYAERVGKSPATGDDDARRAVMAVGTATLAALIPAVIGFVEFRRKKHMQ